MPQLFHVVRCYACQVFQVQQVKKIPKWVCKMCGEKQSLKKEYSRGSGSDCRRHVQKLNMLTAGEFRNPDRDETLDSRQEIKCHNFATRRPNVRLEDDDSTVVEARQPNSFFANPEAESSASRWQAFVADGDEMPANDNDSLPQLGNVEVTLSRPVYQGRGGRKFGEFKSERKRKRKDQDIDVDPVKETCENRNFFGSASRQNRPVSSGCLKIPSFQDPENDFPNLLPSVIHPPSPSRQLSNVGDTDRARVQTWKTQVENSTPGKIWDRNDSADAADATDARKVAKKRQPEATSRSVSSRWGQFLTQDSAGESDNQNEDVINNRGSAESGWSAGSKWGQFLHESEDTNDENEEVVDNRGHVAKPFSEFEDARTTRALVHTAAIPRDRQSTVDQICRTEDIVDNRGHASAKNEQQIDNTSCAELHTAEILNESQSTVDQICRTEDVVDTRGHASKDLTVSSALASDRQHTGRQSTVDPIRPVTWHETSAQGCKFDRTQTKGSDEGAKTSKNRSGFPTKIKDLFSLEDEGILVEALQENW